MPQQIHRKYRTQTSDYYYFYSSSSAEGNLNASDSKETRNNIVEMFWFLSAADAK